MKLRSLFLSCIPLAALFLVGCAGEDVPADAPPTPEAGDPSYDAYNSGGRGGPPSGGDAGAPAEGN